MKSNFKGQGIATKLMVEGEQELIRKGETVVRLTVAQQHPYLIKMYMNKGFKIIDERPLQALPYDEYIMEKTLSRG